MHLASKEHGKIRKFVYILKTLDPDSGIRFYATTDPKYCCQEGLHGESASARAVRQDCSGIRGSITTRTLR
jgi:hypothetical protein